MTIRKQESGNTQSPRLFTSRPDGTIECGICAHACALRDGQRGKCMVRRRLGNVLVSLVYGQLVAENVDPIEKKPLFHVLPGSLSYSIATLGCNFHCRHCQNASISQISKRSDIGKSGIYRNPAEVVERAVMADCQSVSYTYVEPTIFFEYAYDCCIETRSRGLKNVFVSNGYMTKAAIRKLAPLVDAINIDLKSFKDDFYRKICGAHLAPVLEAISLFKELGVWVEVTTLVIPGLNDSDQELVEIVEFLTSIDPEIPWHVTGFYPAYKMPSVSPTSPEKLAVARDIGLGRGLRNVYTGNRPGSGGENSFCPGCGAEVITRLGFQIRKNRLQLGRCPECQSHVPGVWE